MVRIKAIALIFSLLIITLPISLATELSVMDAAGKDNIRNYFRAGDRIHINASALIDGDAQVDGNQFRVYIEGERGDTFDEGACPTINGKPTCSYLRSAPSAGTRKYEIKLYDDNSKWNENAIPLANRTEKLTADTIGADFSNMNVTSKIINNGKVIVSATAIDRAFDPNDDKSCSGVSQTKFYLDDTTKAPFKTVPGNLLCSQKIDFEQVFANLADGSHSIIATTIDRFNLTNGPRTDTFMMDASAPKINDTLTIVESATGQDVTYARGDSDLRVTITAQIDDPYLDTDTIVADFANFNPNLGQLPPTTYTNGVAKWDQIPLRGFGSCQLTIKAADVLGNQGARTINCQLKVDNTGPEQISLDSGHRNQNGVMLLASTSQITATIKEEGVGLAKNNMFLDTSDINGDTRARSQGCAKQSSNEWKCTWRVQANRNPGNKQTGLSQLSTDDLGNMAVPKPKIAAILDSMAPVITNFSMRIIPGADNQDTAVKGASAEFTLTGSEMDIATIDLSMIGGSNETQMTCTQNTCTTIFEIQTSGPYYATVSAIAADFAGNQVKKTLGFDVYGVKGETPNYWESQTTCAPSMIDRSTTVLIEPKAYCDANLKSVNKYAVPIQIAFPGKEACTGDIAAVTSITIFNTLPGSRHPTFEITLRATDYTQDKLTITCPILIQSIVNESGKLYSNPNTETENVNIVIPFYNQPLGDAYANINRQVDDAVKDAKESLKLIGQLESFFAMASKACNIIQIFRSIQGAYYALIALFGNIQRATGAVTPAAAKAKVVQDKLCRGAESTEASIDGKPNEAGLFNILTQLCAFVNCRMSTSDDGYLAQFGGGAKHCKAVAETLASIGGVSSVVNKQGQPRGVPLLDEKKYTDLGGNPSTLDMKENLILSTLCMCVPGIIHNLNKYREIKCDYALCMLRDVKESGLPPKYCQDLKSYQTCNFVVGDVFNVFPIVRLWDTVMQIVRNIYANPFELLQLYGGWKCKDYCNTAIPEQFASCVYPKILAKIGDAIQSIKAIKSIANFNKQGGSCQTLEDLTNSTVSA